MPKTIQFPRITRVNIQNYQLYPGPDGAGGLDWSFEEGTTLGVGINGLGKTTFLNALLLGLVGTQRLPKSDTLGLGSGRFELTKATRVRFFAERVADRAENGTLELWYELGRKPIYIRRRLKDLAIEHLRIGRLTVSEPTDDDYLDRVAQEAGLQNGYQFFVTVNFLLFFLEGRTPLLWDRTSQFEMLRILFVDDALAAELATLNRKMIEADSELRNVRAVLNKLAKDYAPQMDQQPSDTAELEVELERLAAEVRGVDENVKAMQDERLRRFAALQDLVERRFRLEVEIGELEQNVRQAHDAYLKHINPSLDTTYKVLMSSLISGTGCGVCGSQEPAIATRVQADLAAGRCPVCHSDHSHQEVHKHNPGAAKALQELLDNLAKKRQGLAALDKSLKEDQDDYENYIRQLQDTQKQRVTVQAQLESQQAQMPLAQDELDRVRAKISEHRMIIADKRRELVHKRERYIELVDKANTDIASATEKVRTTFADYASSFLTETVELEYGQVGVKVAQELPDIQLPSFTVKMTSGVNPDTPMPREQEDSVSESQREFLELAFRMALMTVATRATNQGLLVMETPEASLDEVFVKKAGGMLRKFAGGRTSRRGAQVIATCNLSGAHMIQWLLSSDGRLKPRDKSDRARRVINFLKIAAKSAAYRNNQAEYDRSFHNATGL